VPLVFLVETSQNSGERTYGQILFDAIAQQIPEWSDWVDSGLVTRKPYQRGAIVNEVTGLGPDEYLNRRQFVLLLGIGADYRAFVEAFYKDGQAPRQSIVGGWMNAYDAEPAYRTSGYQWDRMFEVTDSDIDAIPPDDVVNRRFRNEFGDATPSKRDQAFSFDAGTFVAETLRDTAGGPEALAQLHVTEDFLDKFAQALKQRQAKGVTGDIRFDNNGQNLGAAEEPRLLSYVQFQGPIVGWRKLDGPPALIALSNVGGAAAGETSPVMTTDTIRSIP
jgi:hypothetical protein